MPLDSDISLKTEVFIPAASRPRSPFELQKKSAAPDGEVFALVRVWGAGEGVGDWGKCGL